MKTGIKSLLFIFAIASSVCQADTSAPKGIVLNLDLQNIQNGLIPNKTLYPLFVPQGGLSTKTIHSRKLLMFNHGDGLDIPHSSLLDPSGTTWVTSIQIIALTDGLVISQGNDDSGFAIYLMDGVVHAALLTGGSVVTLRESTESGLGRIIKKRVTIVLKINSDSASLILNRTLVAHAPLKTPLAGNNLRIRIGEHTLLPVALKQNLGHSTSGFTGAVGSLKILRQ